MGQGGVWKESYRVRAYETDPTGRASIVSLCNYLQEAAANHARELGVSVEHLQRQNSTWVLSRLRVRVDRYPAWRDEIDVETWPSGTERLFATRDFIVKNADGDVLVRAVSWWLMIDIESRRPLRLPEFISSLTLSNRERALNGSRSNIPEPRADANARELRVQYADLDVNGHANNVRYVEWALEGVPKDVLNTMHVMELDVLFKAETVHGDPVTVAVDSVDSKNAIFVHAIRSSLDGRYLAGLSTTWRKS